MVLLSQPQSYATEEVRKAELLRERGDILIHRNVDLAQASGCYKKVGRESFYAAATRVNGELNYLSCAISGAGHCAALSRGRKCKRRVLCLQSRPGPDRCALLDSTRSHAHARAQAPTPVHMCGGSFPRQYSLSLSSSLPPSLPVRSVASLLLGRCIVLRR